MHLKIKPSTLPNARDRDFQEFVLRMGDTGFSHFPSGAELDLPTFISSRGCTVIDYVMIRGAPGSGYALEELTPMGHRSLRVSVDWPSATVTKVHERTSHRRHFWSSPPEGFFTDFTAAHGLQGIRDFTRFWLTRVFNLFVLALGVHFMVSRGLCGTLSGEPWYRYLSEAELGPLRSLESEVASLLASARLGSPPAGLKVKAAELRLLRRSLHSRATGRLFSEVQGSLDDPTRLWTLVKRFRVKSEQGALPIDTLVHHFCAVFNRVADPIPVAFVGQHPCEVEALDRLFTHEDLDAAMKDLSWGTAPGGDGDRQRHVVGAFQGSACLGFLPEPLQRLSGGSGIAGAMDMHGNLSAV